MRTVPSQFTSPTSVRWSPGVGQAPPRRVITSGWLASAPGASETTVTYRLARSWLGESVSARFVVTAIAVEGSPNGSSMLGVPYTRYCVAPGVACHASASEPSAR